MYGIDGQNSIEVRFTPDYEREFKYKYPEYMTFDHLDGTLVVVHQFRICLNSNMS